MYFFLYFTVKKRTGVANLGIDAKKPLDFRVCPKKQMMKYSLSLVTCALFCSLFLVSCSSDEKLDEEATNKLLGRWELVEATRNGNATESLDDLFFEFNPDGSMRSNILGATYSAQYETSASTIRQISEENGLDLEYSISSLTDSVLILTTELRRYDFRFELKKAAAEQ